MKFIPLVWAGLWRKKLRTMLTVLSILVAFSLFGLLQGISQGTQQLLQASHLNRLFVIGTDELTRLPLPYRDRISRIRGVNAVAIFSGFGAEYQDPKNVIPVLGTEAASFKQVYPELVLPENLVRVLESTPSGALAGGGLVSRFGWKVGDNVPLQSADGKVWVFRVVGTFDSHDQDIMNFRNRLIVNYRFLAELRNDPTVGAYIVSIDDPGRAATISEAIDQLFTNSPAETETRSEKEFAQTVVKQMGDITFFINAIVAAAFFTLLFLTGTTMWQSVRERLPEFGVLKAIGFSDRALITLVVTESLFLYSFCAVAGLLALQAIFPYLRGGPGGSLQMSLAPIVIVWGLGLAIALALLSGVLPAWRVKRLTVTDTLTGG